MTCGRPYDRAFSSCLEWGLYACSRVYELAVRCRLGLYSSGVLRQKSLPCKVISIGNLTVGGTGKTPMVEYVANLLKGLGLKVAVISRGYRGCAQRRGGIVSEGKGIVMGRLASGDEPQLLAARLEEIPLLVGKDRYRVGKLAIRRFSPSVLILDDAFQHLPLKRDLDLLLLDSMRPFGNGYLVPRGALREPMDQARRASAFVLTRWAEASRSIPELPVIHTYAQGRPIFRCIHQPETLFLGEEKRPIELASLKGRRLFVFSGIARNEYFRESVVKLEGRVAGFLEFTDHHRYDHSDLERIWKRATDLNVDNLITTEKDYVNILTDIPSTPELLVLGIAISFGADAERFNSYIKRWALSR